MNLVALEHACALRQLRILLQLKDPRMENQILKCTREYGEPLQLWDPELELIQWLCVDAYQGERSYIDPVFFLDAIRRLNGEDPLLDWAHTIGMVAFLYEQFACLDMYGASALNIREIYIPDIFVNGLRYLCEQPSHVRTMKEGSAPFAALLRGSPVARSPLPLRCAVGTDRERTDLRDFGSPNRLMTAWADRMQGRFTTNTPTDDFIALRPKPPGNKETRKRAARMQQFLLTKELVRQLQRLTL
eukprot:GHVR01181694.1.p1 GENE.GHVR01181694.1~~GHVR01181694.1.p1  ORF type:complete len:245 (+),score=1.07 GHVR01181694.1:84-818(+)